MDLAEAPAAKAVVACAVFPSVVAEPAFYCESSVIPRKDELQVAALRNMAVVVKVHPGRTSPSVTDLYKPDAAQSRLSKTVAD